MNTRQQQDGIAAVDVVRCPHAYVVLGYYADDAGHAHERDSVADRTLHSVTAISDHDDLGIFIEFATVGGRKSSPSVTDSYEAGGWDHWLIRVVAPDEAWPIDRGFGRAAGFRIGQAVALLQAGLFITRKGWGDPNQYLGLRTDENQLAYASEGAVDLCPLSHVYVRLHPRLVVAWVCSQVDLLATDWIERFPHHGEVA
jgi:hypothetical protein